ncbi:MAG TPA: T9SS type A sorting domain-containing protein, partial [candidate division Zixibacteria bacterium]|nr:T9SS type A sorting domain-containing protein [candidate division Zixibacteria bacterium]
LNHCKGHLVFVDEACSLWVDTSKAVSAIKKDVPKPLWEFKLNLNTNDNTFSRTLTLGVADGATKEVDEGLDQIVPPAFPNEMDARLGAYYITDSRPEDTKITWTLVTRGEVNLSADLSNVPEDYDVYIQYKEDLINLREVGELALPAGTYEVIAARRAVPVAYKLGQNFPNPFNAACVINYELPERAQVRLEIYDLSGHRVRTLVNDEQSAGYRSVVWDGTDDNGNVVPSGVYFYKLTAGKFTDTKRMILSK